MKERFLGHQKHGAAIKVGERHITPVARSLVLPAPGGWGGFVYNRPMAVLVRSDDGREQRLPVHDVTRMLQLLMVAGAAAIVLSAWLLTRLWRR